MAPRGTPVEHSSPGDLRAASSAIITKLPQQEQPQLPKQRPPPEYTTKTAPQWLPVHREQYQPDRSAASAAAVDNKQIGGAAAVDSKRIGAAVLFPTSPAGVPRTSVVRALNDAVRPQLSFVFGPSQPSSQQQQGKPLQQSGEGGIGLYGLRSSPSNNTQGTLRIEDSVFIAAPYNSQSVANDRIAFAALRKELDQPIIAASPLLLSLLVDEIDAEFIRGVVFNVDRTIIDQFALKEAVDAFIRALASGPQDAAGESQNESAAGPAVALDPDFLQQNYPSAVVASDYLPLGPVVQPGVEAPPSDIYELKRRIEVARAKRKMIKRTAKEFEVIAKQERKQREGLMVSERDELHALVKFLLHTSKEREEQSRTLRKYIQDLAKVENRVAKQEQLLADLANKTYAAKLRCLYEAEHVEARGSRLRTISDEVHTGVVRLAAEQLALTHRADLEERYAAMLGNEAGSLSMYATREQEADKALSRDRKVIAKEAAEGFKKERKELKQRKEAMKRQLNEAKRSGSGSTFSSAPSERPIFFLREEELFAAAQQISDCSVVSLDAFPSNIAGNYLSEVSYVAAHLSVTLLAQALDHGSLGSVATCHERVGFPVTIAVDVLKTLGTATTARLQHPLTSITVGVAFDCELITRVTSGEIRTFAEAVDIQAIAAEIRSNLETRIQRGEGLRHGLAVGTDMPEKRCTRGVLEVIHLGAPCDAHKSNLALAFDSADDSTFTSWVGADGAVFVGLPLKSHVSGDVLRSIATTKTSRQASSSAPAR